MTWDHAIDAIKNVGFPAAFALLLLFFGNKWVTMIVAELRAFGARMEATTNAMQTHVTAEANRTIAAFHAARASHE